MAEHIDGPVMAEAIGVTAGMYLGGAETLRSLEVEVYEREARAVVWAELREMNLHSQLNAVSAFVEVLNCYEDELELDLRFGTRGEAVSERAVARVAVLSGQ